MKSPLAMPKKPKRYYINHPHLRFSALVGAALFIGFFSAYELVRNTEPLITEAQSIYSPPGSIAADCSADETTNLRAWLATVPDGSSISFPAGACYRIETGLKLIGRNNLTIDGQGAEFRTTTDATEIPAPADEKPANWPRTRQHWNITNSNNIILRNVVVRGSNTANIYDSDLEAQHAFGVSGSSDVLLENDKGYDVYGDFVGTGSSTRLTVRGGDFSGAGRQGFGINSGNDLLFENFTMTRVARSAIDVEPTQSLVVSGFTARNATINAPIKNGIFANGGTGAMVENVRIENIQVHGRNWSASMETSVSSPAHRRNYTIINNVSDSGTNHPPAFKFLRIDNIYIAGNYQTFTGKLDGADAAIVFQDSCGVAENNTFPGAPIISSGVVACAGADGSSPDEGGSGSSNDSGSTQESTSGSESSTTTTNPTGEANDDSTSESGGNETVGINADGSLQEVADAPMVETAVDVPLALVRSIANPRIGKQLFGKYYIWIITVCVALMISIIGLLVYEAWHHKQRMLQFENWLRHPHMPVHTIHPTL